MKSGRKVVSVSLPPEIAKEYEELAEKEAKNKSQLFREMFQLYKETALKEKFYKLQQYGTGLARKRGIIKEEDIEKIVFEGR
jgi:metal-responsive CopG/Arc/MetJ family transcriptional regulator